MKSRGIAEVSMKNDSIGVLYGLSKSSLIRNSSHSSIVSRCNDVPIINMGGNISVNINVTIIVNISVSISVTLYK